MRKGKHVAGRTVGPPSKGWALPLALTLLLTMSTMAWADNLQVNTVNIGGGQGIAVEQGASVSIQVRISATGGDGGPTGPGGTCNASSSNPVVVSLNAASLPTGASAGSTSFTGCGVYQTVVLSTASSAVPGTYTVSTNNSGGLGTTNNDSFAFRIDAAVPTDSTGPVVISSVAGTLGDNGWYVTDVAVGWDVSDPESMVSSTSGCGSSLVVADTAGQTFTCSATSAGGTTSESVTIKRDGMAPGIVSVGPASAPDGSNGWYITPVEFQFAANDATSGLADPGKALFSVSSGLLEGADVRVDSGPVVDQAGNVNVGVQSSGAKVDLSDPTTTCSSAPTYLLGQSGASVSATIQDSVSGPALSTVSASVDTSVVGLLAADITGYDNAGRSNTASCAYNVVYDFRGFFQPIDNSPSWNRAKAGSAIPVKFSLDGDQGLSVLKAGFPKATTTACPGGTTPTDTVEQYADPANSGLNFDADAGQYIYVWKTSKNWAGGCYKFELGLKDGTSRTFLVNFTK